jgi:hypothetical protein
MAPSTIFGIIAARDVVEEPKGLNGVPLAGMIISVILAMSSLVIISAFLSMSLGKFEGSLMGLLTG